jgi:hypothetical protein
LDSSPLDLNLLIKNQLFQTYSNSSSSYTQSSADQSATLAPQVNNLMGVGAQVNGAQTTKFGTQYQQQMSFASQTQSNHSSSKVPHKTIEQLIIHNSDTQVKPIIGNKEIEKVQEQTFNP